MTAREYFRDHGYPDVAKLINTVMGRFQKRGSGTRRNWWEVCAGDGNGNPRTIAGIRFPVLAVAQMREGMPITPSARPHRGPPPPPKSYRGRSACRSGA
jgi:hypothetical protein